MRRVHWTAAVVVIAALALAGRSRADSGQPGDVSGSGAPVNDREQARPHYVWRAVLESSLFFAGNTAWYYLPDKGNNAPDWDLGWDWTSWKRKLITLDALRFDSNSFPTNVGTHTEAGLIIYTIGRGNGLTLPSSLLLTFGEAVAWEYLAEYHEKPSINDLANNPLGGMAIGEPLYQLSRFFARGRNNFVNPTLAALLSPLSAVNGWADHERPQRAPSTDRLGFPQDVWHQFRIYSGFGDSRWGQVSRTETQLGISTALNAVPGYLQPAASSGWFGPGRVTGIDANVSLAGGMTGALFATRVALGGYHLQGVTHDGSGRPTGYSLLGTLTNVFDYSNRLWPGLPLDQVALFGVLGPTAEVYRRAGDFEARVRAEAFPDFGMITSLAGDRYREQFGVDGAKTVFVRNGYYFGYGVTTRAELAVRFHAWSAGAETRWERFGSFDVRDRFQEELTNDFHLTDGRTSGTLWTTLTPKPGFGQVGAALQRIVRWGTIDDMTEERREDRAALTFALVF